MKEQMSSLYSAESCIEAILDKIIQIKYMQELDKKITPYTLGHTII